MLNKRVTISLSAVIVVCLLLVTGCGPMTKQSEMAVKTARFSEEEWIAVEVQEEPGEDPTQEATEEQEMLLEEEPAGTKYILNTNTKKFHIPDCSSVGQMKEKNKEYFTGDRETVIARGFVPCKRCKP